MKLQRPLITHSHVSTACSAPVGVAAEWSAPSAGQGSGASTSDTPAAPEDKAQQIAQEVQRRKARQAAISAAAEQMRVVVFKDEYLWKVSSSVGVCSL